MSLYLLGSFPDERVGILIIGKSLNYLAHMIISM